MSYYNRYRIITILHIRGRLPARTLCVHHRNCRRRLPRCRRRGRSRSRYYY